MRIKGIIESEIKSILEERYILSISKINYFPIGEDGACYIVETNDKKYFCKVYNKKPLAFKSIREIKAVIEFLFYISQSTNIKGIPAPLSNKNGNVISLHKGFPVVLYDYIEGKNIELATFRSHELRNTGKLLGKIHNLNSKNFHKLKHEDLSLQFEGKIEGIIKKLSSSVYPKGTRLLRLQNSILPHIDILGTSILYLRETVSYIKKSSSRCVLVHGDLHHGNMMKTKDGISLIDWDGLEIALPEKDVMWFGELGKVDAVFLKSYYSTQKKFKFDKKALKYYIIRRLIGSIVFFCRRIMLNDDLEKAEFNNYLKEIKNLIGHLEKLRD
jgi:spectinomycin phosphotransferase